MCEHSLARAAARGFKAMQFNFVVSTNERALRLWHACGFEIVGRLPAAFEHPERGYVDVFVMYRSLAEFVVLAIHSPAAHMQEQRRRSS
jgi:ribosomal protein S18 acetylase RimI-like enzyme